MPLWDVRFFSGESGGGRIVKNAPWRSCVQSSGSEVFPSRDGGTSNPTTRLDVEDQPNLLLHISDSREQMDVMGTVW